MPRPLRCRRICCEPEYLSFAPEEAETVSNIVLTLDEYEVIRLVDLEKHTHEHCAALMDISRSTVTEIYESAREKLARTIVYGSRLEISGGRYRFCDGTLGICNKRNCSKRASDNGKTQFCKGENIMRIAVTYENGNVFGHFGHTEQFKFYDVENGNIVNEAVIDTNGSGHGALADFLKNNNADAVICGGMGSGARMALAQAGIKVYGGVLGSADEAVKAFIAGGLNFDPNASCSHHNGEHHGNCGEHGCADHECGGHCH